MGVKERIERWLFWSERTGFLILALSWASVETPDRWGLLSPNKFWTCTTYLMLFWKWTTSFYFLVYAGNRLLQILDKQIRHPTLPTKPLLSQGKSKTVLNPGFLFEQITLLICESGALLVKNAGFLMERLALLFWAGGVNLAYLRDPRAFWIMHSSCMIIFPLLNIYFAWLGYSAEFQQNLHHHQKKKLVDGENISRTAKEESTKQQMNAKTVYRRAERVLFWVERLGFSVLTLSWLSLSIVDEIVSRDLLLTCIAMVGCFWKCTNLLYFLMYIGRLLAEDHDFPSLSVDRRPQLEVKGKEKQNSIIAISCVWVVNNFKNHPGFWLERLALLVFARGVNIFVSSDNPGADIALDYCFLIIFPLLHIYFAWFGYSKEFQKDHNDLPVKLQKMVKVGTAKKEIQFHFQLSSRHKKLQKAVNGILVGCLVLVLAILFWIVLMLVVEGTTKSTPRESRSHESPANGLAPQEKTKMTTSDATFNKKNSGSRESTTPKEEEANHKTRQTSPRKKGKESQFSRPPSSPPDPFSALRAYTKNGYTSLLEFGVYQVPTGRIVVRGTMDLRSFTAHIVLFPCVVAVVASVWTAAWVFGMWFLRIIRDL